MDAMQAILGRRSYRVYKDQEVPEDVIKDLLQAGMNAPSAVNSQPWEFLVMRDAEKKQKTSDLASYWSMLGKAPLGILVLANRNGYRANTKEFFIQDCSAATENILLAAEAQGLGGVWLGLYPKMNFVEAIREIYGIPEHILPFSLLSIGYPDKPMPPHGKFHDMKVHWDEY